MRLPLADSAGAPSAGRSNPNMLLPLLFLLESIVKFSSTDAITPSSSDNNEGQHSSKYPNPSDCITATKQ